MRRRTRTKAEAYPEGREYKDGGCELAPRCLDCPLPRCRYDEPGGARRLLGEARSKEILRRRDEGHVSIKELIRQYGLSRRQIFRILEKARKTCPDAHHGS